MKKDPSRFESLDRQSPNAEADPHHGVLTLSCFILETSMRGLVKAFGSRMDISQRKGTYPTPRGPSTVLNVEFLGIMIESVPNENEFEVAGRVLDS